MDMDYLKKVTEVEVKTFIVNEGTTKPSNLELRPLGLSHSTFYFR